MSTKGECEVISVLNAPNNLAMGIGNSLMWIGDEYQKWLEREAARKKVEQDALEAWSRSQFDEIRSSLTMQSESIALEKAQQAPYAGSSKNDEALLRAVRQARSALTDVNHAAQSFQDLKREAFTRRLMVEIEACRTLLPPGLIAQAESTLGHTDSAMQDALHLLQEARSNIETTVLREDRQRRQTVEALRIAASHRQVVNDMFRSISSQVPLEFIEQQRALEDVIAAATARLETSSEEAFELATEAQRVARLLSDHVSAYLLNTWNSMQSKINTVLGTLSSLRQMTDEAVLIEGADAAQLDTLTRRIADLYNETRQMGQSFSVTAQHRVILVGERVELLKQEVFNVIETFQQRAVAETIATTLADLGLRSAMGELPVAQKNGDTTRIVAMRTGNTLQEERDDKLVAFTVSHTGVTYDFSGYEGDTCVEEAERIFAALRTRGIYLLDIQTAAQLQAAYPEGVTRRVIDQLEFYPHLTKNKAQPELVDRIRSVLGRMNYQHIRQSSVGGCIELDAFNGSIGYHVVLNPDGAMSVLKDAAQSDVSGDISDPIVAEGQQVLEHYEDRPHREGVARRKEHKGFIDTRKHLLEQ